MSEKLRTSLILALCVTFLPAAVLAASHHAEVLEGNLTLKRVTDFDLLVTIDDHPRPGGDGVADEAFVYRSQAILAELPEVDGPGRLIVRPQSLVIEANGAPRLTLAVLTKGSGDESALTADSYGLGIDSGYQLSRLHAANGEDLITFAQAMLQPVAFLPSFKEVIGGEGDCISGGPGATSCSIEGNIGPGGAGCSVTCGSGYACCNLSGCHCGGLH
jgi:hypothetical protein